ncbi:hypothetical protein H0H87_012266 [Tephrocybe sp. NHM501043]|nr:hypothetical protein H0H87_012266 [Tephrocybe sp. NHM501043]
MDQVTTQLLRLSWEKLEYIIENPNFAKCIKTLEPDISFWLELLGENPEISRAALESLSSPELRRLSMLARNIDSMSMQGFGHLTELDLFATSGEAKSDLIGLDLVLHHSPMLESLSVVGLVQEEIFLLLPCDPAILPRLKSFRLLAEIWTLLRVTEAQLQRLSQFLEHRTLLRRLSLRLGGADWDIIQTLLPAIRQLQALEVFGFNAGGRPMAAEDFINLASVLTPRISSIQLVIPWDYPDTLDIDVTILAPLLERLKALPHLRFIHLYSQGRVLPIIPDDLVADLVHLHTLGYDRSLWDVLDGCLIPWSPWHVRYAVDEDFDCLDDAWLFRHL